MKNYLKTSKGLRWAASGAFGLMLVLNVMVSLEFENGKMLPSLTLMELGNVANAQSETGSTYRWDNGRDCCSGSGNCYISDPKIC